ncbi:AcrR family transcriptional regulator [Streptomonospora nanhaiensis]|uniref:AcrR family transcriptional regulator n=1 Tax=Streptomonospora nanhaiensis TaxID=1323731 RepID=A0A853BR30_9ACTN|nr:AcrR family transcriptional regulator [Streptomonospora nanhaiensis]
MTPPQPTGTPRPGTRAERRRRTEERVLASARALFAESGYDRTTIRAVAAAANTDPALVMRYFGSKEELFSRATEAAPEAPISGTPDEVAELLLASFADKLDTDATATLAMLRSMLTHPEAASDVRAAVSAQQGQAAAAMPGDNADVRAGIIGAAILGVVVGRRLLRLDGLADAPAEEVVALLRPVVRGLVNGVREPGPAGTADPDSDPGA